MSKDHGGRMTFRLSNGILISLRGTMNIVPTRMSVTPHTQADGSVDRSGEMKPATAEIVFADRGIDYDALISGPRFNVTMIEDFSGDTHYFNEAFVSGDPTVNRINGEVTGVTINCEAYDRVRG